MPRRPLALLVAAVAALVLAAPAGAAVRLEPVGTFAAPVFVTAPAGDTGRVFVVQRGGTVVLLKGGVRQAAPFLTVGVDTAGERGLLSMAFAPDYATSGLFYTFSIPASGALRIEERRRSASDPDVADPAYVRPVLVIPHGLQSNHNGGQLQFGPGGMLYVGTGDGGGVGDPYDNGQRLGGNPAAEGQNPLLGKLLRIDPRGAAPYAIPAGNPFAAPNAPEIWAYGLRNPWRFSFDRATGDLVIADVGQSAWEEVDFAPAAAGGGRGANFGWDDWEGTHTFDGGGAAQAGPVLEHAHSAGWCSITGGYVVRDPSLPDLVGQYVYGDFCLGKVRAARLSATGATADRDLGLAGVPQLTSFGQDACGRVYVVSLAGPVYRLADSGACSTATTGAGDTRAPVLSLRFASRQRVLRTGVVSLRARCSEPCAVRASGRVALSASAARVLRTGTVRGSRRASTRSRTRVRVHVGPRSRARIRRALRRGQAATVRLTLSATDTAGNRRVRRLAVRVRR